MTQDQVMGLLRQLIPVLGGIAISLGFLSPETVAKLSGLAVQIGGPLIVVIGAVWALIANSKSSIIASATLMPEVDSKKLAEAIVDPKLKEVAKTAVT